MYRNGCNWLYGVCTTHCLIYHSIASLNIHLPVHIVTIVWLSWWYGIINSASIEACRVKIVEVVETARRDFTGNVNHRSIQTSISPSLYYINNTYHHTCTGTYTIAMMALMWCDWLIDLIDIFIIYCIGLVAFNTAFVAYRDFGDEKTTSRFEVTRSIPLLAFISLLNPIPHICYAIDIVMLLFIDLVINIDM